MKTYWTVMLGLLCMIAHLVAGADELLIPVDFKTAEKVSEYNGNAIKISLYSSMRHKIVKINESLLLDTDRKEPFTLSLFDGEKLTIKPEDIEQINFRTISWLGEIQYPSVKEKIQQAKRISPEHANVLNALTTLDLMLLSWDIIKVSGEATLASNTATGMSTNTATRMSTNTANMASEITEGQIEDSKIPDIERHAFKTVRGTFTSLRTDKKYRIENLKYTPRYHILYEIDPEKTHHAINEIPGERVARKKRLLLNEDKGELLRRLVEAEKKNEEKILQFEQFLDGLVRDNSDKKIMGEI